MPRAYRRRPSTLATSSAGWFCLHVQLKKLRLLPLAKISTDNFVTCFNFNYVLSLKKKGILNSKFDILLCSGTKILCRIKMNTVI